jgi:predicted aldo/keto reductase-like oxidoreductase
MLYKQFGKTDWKISNLGMGALRLPIIDNQWIKIDKKEASRMIHKGIDYGINYIDTAYHYHMGQSEVFLGEALLPEHRKKVKIATKLMYDLVSTSNDFDKILNKQLKRLKTDFIDFYLLQALDAQSWERLSKMDVIGWAEKMIAAGKIGGLGFSFHGTLPTFRTIIDSYDKWAVCYIQYNYMDTHYQAGTEGLRYAYSKGVPVVIMEPLRGGQLANVPTKAVENIWKQNNNLKSHIHLALQWIWNHEEVTAVLSGMSNVQQLEQNVEIANTSYPGSLTNDEIEIINRVRNELMSLNVIPCTRCGYCLPCPKSILIPYIFETYNEFLIYKSENRANSEYNVFMYRRARADNCTKCRKCESICPQGIQICDWLEKVHMELSQLNKKNK